MGEIDMTTTGTDRAAALQLAPYLFFYGRCDEALEFYKSVFGGTYELTRNADGPMKDQIGADFQNKVMHASFTAPGVTFMCSDGREAKTIDPEEGNVSLCLSATDADAGKRVFDALAAGGNVLMPFGDAFWGGKFGMVNDRFGTQWMVTSS
jgi:PhnB protein